MDGTGTLVLGMFLVLAVAVVMVGVRIRHKPVVAPPVEDPDPTAGDPPTLSLATYGPAIQAQIDAARADERARTLREIQQREPLWPLRAKHRKEAAQRREQHAGYHPDREDD